MKKSRITRWILLALVVAGLGYYGWQRLHGENREAAAGGAQKAATRNPVRVSVAAVEKADFPVYLTSLGTVQAFNTVLVRSRVDGQIDKIAFTEGQYVKQGDLLTKIDPRPYQAALDAAKAKKEQDEANLANITWTCSASSSWVSSPPASSSIPSAPAYRNSRPRSRLTQPPSTMHRPSSTIPTSRRRFPVSSACVRSMLAISSMLRPRPGSSQSLRLSRLPSFSPRPKISCLTSKALKAPLHSRPLRSPPTASDRWRKERWQS